MLSEAGTAFGGVRVTVCLCVCPFAQNLKKLLIYQKLKMCYNEH